MTIIPVARILAEVIVGIVKVVDLPLIAWHQWELPLPAPVVALADNGLNKSISCW